MTEPAADFRPPVDVAGDAIEPALFLDDAGKSKIVAFEAGDLSLEERTPAKAFA